MKKFVWSLLVLMPVLAFSLDFKQLESSGVQLMYAARTSAVSTHTAVGYGLGWSLYAVGGTADFTIKYSSVAEGDPNVNSSSTVYILSGQSMSGEFKAMVYTPIISIDRIDTPGTTVYIEVPYLAPRAPGAF